MKNRQGSVKLLNMKSQEFSISNVTRQGSILSPILWCVYMDGLFLLLRKRKLGCFIRGLWYGATAYADDVLCMAPTRSMLQRMIDDEYM